MKEMLALYPVTAVVLAFGILLMFLRDRRNKKLHLHDIVTYREQCRKGSIKLGRAFDYLTKERASYASFWSRGDYLDEDKMAQELLMFLYKERAEDSFFGKPEDETLRYPWTRK